MRTFLKRVLPGRTLRFAQTFQQLEPAARPALCQMALLRLLRLHRDRLPALSGRPRSILFLCHGNILRSPMAAELLSKLLASEGWDEEEITSAGFIATGGRSADPRGRRSAAAFGVSLEAHRSQVVSADLVARAELIVAMDRDNEARLLTQFPTARRKLLLLGSFAPEQGDPFIPDPYTGTEEAVAASYVRIDRAVRALWRELRELPPVPSRPMGLLKRVARTTLTSPVLVAGAESLSGGHAAVFLLHRFSSSDEGSHGFPTSTLRARLEWLRRRRYHIAPLGDLIHAFREGRPTPPRTVAFTVDDGYANFAEVAAPIFAEFDCPVTVFLVTDFLDGRRWLWWDELRFAFEQRPRQESIVDTDAGPLTLAWDSPVRRKRELTRFIEVIKRLPARRRDALIRRVVARLEVDLPAVPPAALAPMTWDTARRLAAGGVTFGPHSCSHVIHSAEDADTSRREIASSWQRVRTEIPGALPAYCYPNGDIGSFGPREATIISELGLQAGISAHPTYLAIGSRPPDPGAADAIPRFSLDPDAVRFVQVASGVERMKQRWRP